MNPLNSKLLLAFGLSVSLPVLGQESLIVVDASGQELATENLTGVTEITFSADETELYVLNGAGERVSAPITSSPVTIVFGEYTSTSVSSLTADGSNLVSFVVEGDELVLASADGIRLVEIFGASGKSLLASRAGRVNVSALPKGVSLVRVTTMKGGMVTRKIIIK